MQTMSTEKAMFPGSVVEHKWSRRDAIENAPLYAMKIVLGAKIIRKPKSYKDYVSIIFDSCEYILDKQDFEMCLELTKGFLFDYVERKGFTVCENIQEFLKYHPALIIDGIKYLANRAKETFEIPDYKNRVFWIKTDETACAYYRSIKPYEYMRDNFDNFYCENSRFITINGLSYFDCIIFGRIPSSSSIAVVQNLKNQEKVIVYETDDDFFTIPDWSVAKLYVKGDQVERARLAADIANVVVTTNETLKQRIGKPEKTFVCPNLIDMDKYKVKESHFRSVQKKFKGYIPFLNNNNKVSYMHGKTRKIEDFKNVDFGNGKDYAPITILWSGSITHDEDLQQIIKPIKMIGEEYGMSVCFTFFGFCPPEFLNSVVDAGNTNQRLDIKDEYAHFVRFLEGVPHEMYAQVLYTINPDFAICPLKDEKFNESKSNIKPLEVGAMGIPSIVSDYGEYKFIEDGYNGIKVAVNDTGGWYNAIKRLIENRDERKRMGKNIYDTVLNEYSWQTNSENRKRWDTFFLYLHDLCQSRKEKINRNYERILNV